MLFLRLIRILSLKKRDLWLKEHIFYLCFFFLLNTQERPSAEVDVKFMEVITLISTYGIVLLPFLNRSSLSRVNK